MSRYMSWPIAIGSPVEKPDAVATITPRFPFGMPTAAQSWAIERALLKQHARYVAPPHDPNIQESMTAHAALMAEITELGKQARAKGAAPKPPANANT